MCDITRCAAHRQSASVILPYICIYTYIYIWHPISLCHRIHRHKRCYARKRRAQPVYMYVNIYIYLHVYVCVCLYIHTYIYIHAYTFIKKKTHNIVFFASYTQPQTLLLAVKSLFCPKIWLSWYFCGRKIQQTWPNSASWNLLKKTALFSIIKALYSLNFCYMSHIQMLCYDTK